MRDRAEDARELLEKFDREAPGQREILRVLADVYHELEDYSPYCRVCHQLVEMEPDYSSWQMMLADGYLQTMRPVSAYRAFQEFLNRWPNDPMADPIREQLAQMEGPIAELLREAPFPESERLELAAMHEESLSALSEGDCQGLIQVHDLTFNQPICQQLQRPVLAPLRRR